MPSSKLPAAIVLTASIFLLLLLPAFGKDIKTLFGAGVDLYARRQYRISLRTFQQVLIIAPKFKEALLMQGRCYMKLDEPRRALANFNQVLQMDATNAEAFLYRAEAHCQLGETAKAIADCTKSLDFKRSQRGFHLRGKLLLQTGDYDKANADLSQALRLGPAEAGILLDRAEVLAKQKRFAQSAQDCTRALQWRAIESEDLARAYRDRAWAYEKQGKPDLAAKDREKIQSMALFEWGQP